MNQDNTHFIDPSKRSLYGKEGGQFWIGKIVAYADQEEQIENRHTDIYNYRYQLLSLVVDQRANTKRDESLTNTRTFFINSRLVNSIFEF